MMLSVISTIPLTLMAHTIYDLLSIADKQYFTKKINNTSNIANNITRHNHNNYEHNVIKKVHKHIKHINNYDTDRNYHSKK